MGHEYKMKDHALFSSTPAVIWRHSIEIKGAIPPRGVNLQQYCISGIQSWKGEKLSRFKFEAWN